jgi:cell division protein FtsW (lipid II flippase)
MHSSSKHVQDFLQEVCKEIRFKSIHEHIIKELSGHIEDQKNDYIDQGFDEETANLKAVEQMGDPAIVGKQLDKTHRPRMEVSILSICAILVVLGGGIQFFLSGVNTNGIDNFSHFLQYAPIGIVAFVLMYFFDYTWLGRYSKFTYFVLLAITAVGFLISTEFNGRYTHVYYSTLLFIPAFAGIIYGFRNKGYLGIIFSSLFYAGAAFMCMKAPSYSSFALLTISCLIILTVAIVKGFFGRNRKLSLALVYVPTLLLTSVVAIFNTVILSHYRIGERITAFFNQGHDPLGSGYQIMLIRKLFFAAKPIGTVSLDGNVGNISIDRILPNWSTDSSLIYLIARLGYIPGMALVAIMIILIIRMFVSVLKQKNAYGFLVTFSACLAITGEIVLYVLSNTGIIAPMSLVLPFISLGAFGFIINMALLGLLLSVYRRTDLVKDRLPSQVKHYNHLSDKKSNQAE